MGRAALGHYYEIHRKLVSAPQYRSEVMRVGYAVEKQDQGLGACQRLEERLQRPDRLTGCFVENQNRSTMISMSTEPLERAILLPSNLYTDGFRQASKLFDSPLTSRDVERAVGDSCRECFFNRMKSGDRLAQFDVPPPEFELFCSWNTRTTSGLPSKFVSLSYFTT